MTPTGERGSDSVDMSIFIVAVPELRTVRVPAAGRRGRQANPVLQRDEWFLHGRLKDTLHVWF